MSLIIKYCIFKIIIRLKFNNNILLNVILKVILIITITCICENRFSEVAELISVCWLEIRGKINTNMLSPATLYTAYLVFKVTIGSFGFVNQPVEVAVEVVGSAGGHKRSVFLDAGRRRSSRHQIVPWRGGRFIRSGILCQPPQPRAKDEDDERPKERGDGWLEMELGEFFNGGEDDDGEVEMSVLEVKGGNWKGGLIIQGIEIRPKRG